MKNTLLIWAIALFSFSCAEKAQQERIIQDFNENWKFSLGDHQHAETIDFSDADWRTLNVPHDWSIELGYQKEGTAASTGFVPGGIGWYRKSFTLSKADQDLDINILFDGVYNNSSVWINGHFLGKRPYGYSSFAYNLSEHLYFDGKENVIAVKVDHSAYVDSRWYTGSGIYRKVQLIKTQPLHIAQWGVQITTPTVSKTQASIHTNTNLAFTGKTTPKNISLQYTVLDASGKAITQKNVTLDPQKWKASQVNLSITNPTLWSLDKPYLYQLLIEVKENDQVVDQVTETFGVRTFKFDANTGFYLNGKNMKLKGVNLHHDAGALGTAVPKSIWEDRLNKLKSIGVNAVRLSHNPHAVELMEVCDEIGLLVMAEAFDEWDRAKAKSLVFLGDNKAPKEAARAYPELFNEWAERDLKDLIKRDFNHPSVIMWSIGNEIEWTFPHYSKTYTDVNGKQEYYKHEPNYDSLTIKNALDKNTGGTDTLKLIAERLSNWIKEVDTTRPVTAGSVHPSIGNASGYGDALGVYGFNYRAIEYDAAHKEYPDLKIVGSENWGAYSEWKNCIERDFVSGIFVWTGFAYLGEAGPWPRKGLNISFFDFAGNKTPKGHFFECLWNDTPKAYIVTTPAAESEFSFNEKTGWAFDMQYYEAPYWSKLRLWEWYKVFPKWQYNSKEPIIVQTYTNCEEAELFLNNTSLGKQKLADFAEDNIIKWLVPFKVGELKVIGYNQGKKVTEYTLNSHGKISQIALSTNKKSLSADGYDVSVITAQLLDENNLSITDEDLAISFDVQGAGKNIGIDNGWEMNIQKHKTNTVTTHNGSATLFVQALKDKGEIKIIAKADGIPAQSFILKAK